MDRTAQAYTSLNKLPLKKLAPSNDRIGACWQHGGMRPTAYRRNARGPRDRQAFEAIRMQAGALFAAGRTQAEVARQLGVARQNVSRWHDRARPAPVRPAPAPGRPGAQAGRPRARLRKRPLDPVARHDRDQAAHRGRLPPGHVWKLLHHRLHYRLQRPARRAVERNERAIARWVAEDWP
jgi:transposase